MVQKCQSALYFGHQLLVKLLNLLLRGVFATTQVTTSLQSESRVNEVDIDTVTLPQNTPITWSCQAALVVVVSIFQGSLERVPHVFLV